MPFGAIEVLKVGAGGTAKYRHPCASELKHWAAGD